MENISSSNGPSGDQLLVTSRRSQEHKPPQVMLNGCILWNGQLVDSQISKRILKGFSHQFYLPSRSPRQIQFIMTWCRIGASKDDYCTQRRSPSMLSHLRGTLMVGLFTSVSRPPTHTPRSSNHFPIHGDTHDSTVQATLPMRQTGF